MSDHEPEVTSHSQREAGAAVHPDGEPNSPFRMEEVEKVEREDISVLTRGTLALLCLGFIAMGGAGWLMLIPAIGMMWSRNFRRWQAWAQILVPVFGFFMLIRSLSDAAELAPSAEMLGLIGGQVLYAGGLTWAVWEPRRLRLAGTICFTGFATFVNVVFFRGVPM